MIPVRTALLSLVRQIRDLPGRPTLTIRWDEVPDEVIAWLRNSGGESATYPLVDGGAIEEATLTLAGTVTLRVQQTKRRATRRALAVVR